MVPFLSTKACILSLQASKLVLQPFLLSLPQHQHFMASQVSGVVVAAKSGRVAGDQIHARSKAAPCPHVGC